MNNSVVENGRLVGFRCYTCQKVKPAMWDETCNECREKELAQRGSALLLARIASLEAALAKREKEATPADYLREKCKRLEAALQAAQKDAERLDWLFSDHERGQALRVQGSNERGWSVLDMANGLVRLSKADTPRAAIDQARLATNESGSASHNHGNKS